MMEENILDLNKEIIVQGQGNEENREQTNKQNNEKKIKYGDVLCNRKTKVYVKLNSAGYVTNVQSDIFLTDATGWTKIDEGEGDRFVFAQTQYFDNPLIDENGNYQIKIEM